MHCSAAAQCAAVQYMIVAQVIVGVVLKMAVQFSGIDAIFYYSTMMFRQANQ